MTVGQIIRLLRRIQADAGSKGMNQKELAELAKVDTATLSRIESGEIKKPSEDILNKIADAFNLSLQELYTFGNISQQSDIDILRVGLGHCIWGAPIIKAIMEDGGISGTYITSYGEKHPDTQAFEPYWYSPEVYGQTGTIRKGPAFVNISGTNIAHSSRFSDWKKDADLKVYTADELIRLMNNGELDCIIVPGEIYENHQNKLIRAASITYTAKQGCHLCAIGDETIIQHLRPSEKDQSINPKEFWEYLNIVSEKTPIHVVYARRTIAEKYFRTFITPAFKNKNNVIPEAIDIGDWGELERFLYNLIDTNSLFLFICWEPQLSWVMESVQQHETISAQDFDFFELSIRDNIPYVSFDILFRKDTHRKWIGKEGAQSLLDTFFSTIESFITQLSRGKEKYDKYPDAEVISQYLNMDKDRCAEALLKLNFRFTYYSEWVMEQ